MPTPEVIEKVRQLREELSGTRPSSPEADRIARELDAVLADPEHAPHYEGLGERLQAAATGVEAKHPQLAAALNSVLAALSGAGV